MRAAVTLRRIKHRPAGITMMETLVVLFLIGAIISLIMPSLAQSRFNTRLLLCQNNMREIGRGFMDFAQSNKQRLPGNTDDRTTAYDRAEASWLFCSVKPAYYTTYDPSIRRKSNPTHAQFLSPEYSLAPETGSLFEFTRHKKLYRCPSLEVGPIKGGKGSNGMFDYGMLNALYGARIDRLPVTAYFTLEENAGRGLSYPKMLEPLPGKGQPWQNLMPIIVEEDPGASVNGCCVEADFSNDDFMANTHRRVGIGDPGVAANYIAADCSVQFMNWYGSRMRARRIWAINQKFGTAAYLGYVGPVNVFQWDDGSRVPLAPSTGEAANSAYTNTTDRTSQGIRVPKKLLPVGYEQLGIGPFP